MKQLRLQTASFQYVERSFKEWLDVLGYSDKTVYGMPNAVREMLYYLENHGCAHLKQINNKQIKSYYQQLKKRTNQSRGGGLSNNSLNKHLQALQKFSDYLRQSGRMDLPKLYIRKEKEDTKKVVVLSTLEVEELYANSYQKTENIKLPLARQEAMQYRDRALLALFYGCGLRRNEGYHLDVSDIKWDRNILHVRKGKGYKERLVPFNKASKKHLQDYVYDWRPYLLRSNKEDAFFLGNGGLRLGDQSLLLRLKLLIQKSESIQLQEKEVGLHTLRHSIATHLLAAGMKLENIAKFLGHSSLESTQIYTHLINEEEGNGTDPQEYNLLNKGSQGVKLSEDERNYY